MTLIVPIHLYASETWIGTAEMWTVTAETWTDTAETWNDTAETWIIITVNLLNLNAFYMRCQR